MNKLQEKEFELLKLFIDICNKYDLKYYLVCGSALGAVKYKGFIPWDDDIDVALLRDDYEKFLEIAPHELPSWVFVQNCRTEPDYPHLGTKLRNTNTTYLEKDFKNLDLNQGIFIDVFPLDGYPNSIEEQKELEKKKMYFYRRRFTKLAKPIHKDILLTIYSLLYLFFGMFKNTQKACLGNEELIKKYSPKESELWCNYANSIRKYEYSPKSHYGEGIFMKFEGLDVRIPEDYDGYLTLKYGDYKADLPDKLKVPSHHYLVDLEKSYKEYV